MSRGTRKKFLSLFIGVSLISVFIFNAQISLAGPAPTTITNCQELQDIDKNLAGTYELGNNIDCSDTITWNEGKGFDPIGKFDTIPFTGSLNGNYHVINDLYINRGWFGSMGVGLFSYINGGSIGNVGLENVNITGGSWVGALVGHDTNGTIVNSYSTGKVIGQWASSGSPWTVVGGLVGMTEGATTISNSFSKATVSGGERVGGLVGYNHSSKIAHSYSTGKITGTNEVGGLVGFNTVSTISHSYSIGMVSGTTEVGGLVGLNYKNSTISDSYWDKETSGMTTMCGYETYGASGCNNSFGKMTVEMKKQATFANWDFESMWSMYEDASYPWLQWQFKKIPIPGDLNGDGKVSVVDVQCAILVVQSELNEKKGELPACLVSLDPTLVDLNKDDKINVVDVLIFVDYSLKNVSSPSKASRR